MLPLILALLFATPHPPEVLSVPVVHAEEMTTESIKLLARQIAEHHGLHVERFLKTIECESSWNPKAVGDNGTSFGLAQLHRPETDWGITREQAEDPYQALEIMARAWERGEAWRWTCWKLLK